MHRWHLEACRRLCTLALASFTVSVCAEPADEALIYSFDDNLLLGNSKLDLTRFNQEGWIEPGQYQVELYINDHMVRRLPVEFRAQADDQVVPCLSDQELISAGIGLEPGEDGHEPRCMAIGERIPGAGMYFDQSLLRLNLSVPQAQMVSVPRGYVPPAQWDDGETMLFANYNTNLYRSDYSNGGVNDYGYLGLNAGFNMGRWRVRHQASYQYSSSDTGTLSKWNSIRTYLQRALPGIRSELTVGDSFTGGNLFGSMAFRGIQLSSDDRMLPDYMRRYAPEIHGVARGNARVVVRQNERVIYETSVPAGPFIISDLGGTSVQGDLLVEVIEADGSRSSFTVPFTAVPESMRPGMFRYNATIGEARFIGSGSEVFGDFTFQYGLSNRVTGNLGLRLADGYAALLSGGVLATSFGAFGFNATFSSASVEDDKRKEGWRLQATYSKTFQPTNTSLTLAGYRYSTEGYRELSDVLGVRDAERNGEQWTSTTYRQRNQFTLTINQSLGRYGSLYLSGSTSDYYDGSSRDTQLQLGYSNTYRQLNYNVSFTRTDSQRASQVWTEGELGQTQVLGSRDNLFMLTLSLPLGGNPRAPHLSNSISRSDNSGTQLQASLTGTAGEGDTLSYGVNVAYDDEQSATTWGGTLQKRFPVASVGANYSQGDGYWQAGVNARGALVLHRGGVTLGPYVGDTFALVEAKGAEGARVRNGQGSAVDRFGYALVPALSPYRYNQIGLDAEGINERAELSANESRIAPYAGAAVRVRFSTLVGHALLIRAQRSKGESIPLGANVFDSDGDAIGMAGQASQVYARVGKDKDRLLVRWGRAESEQCAIDYDLAGLDTEQPMIRLVEACQ